jgi:DNA-binding beta-propeller fold protein YncE
MKRLVLVISMLGIIISCRKDIAVVDVKNSGYPTEIGNMLLIRCAGNGCHNTETRSAGLDLSSWQKLFEGAGNGSAVIPYAPMQSSLFQFCNTFAELGPVTIPTMPINGSPLNKQEMVKIRDWILKGAPDQLGTIAFSGKPKRSKYYVCNQGCDLITVFDQESTLPMRSIPCGLSASIESPHQIKISPDGKYYYIIFTAGGILQKFSAENDSPLAYADLGLSNWNTVSISKDGSTAVCVDWSSSGQIAVVDLLSMKVKIRYPSNLFVFPHGSAISPDNRYLLISSQIGNFIYRIPIGAPYSITNPNLDDIVFSINGQTPSNVHGPDPHEIIYNEQGDLFFVSCQGTDEVRVFNASTFQLKEVIKTPMYPQELAISKDGNTLVVSCPEDTISFPRKRGSVSVIDIPSLSVLKTFYTGHQPHGISIDNKKKWVVVANRNVAEGGPAPHHTASCVGKNGYLSFINLQTMTMVDGKRIEVSVDPYYVSVREGF